MTWLRNRDVRFRWLAWKLTAFVIFAIAGIVLLAVALAWSQGYFVERTRIHFVAADGKNLRAGLAVKLSGFRIGIIDKTSLTEDAKVSTELLIENRYMKWVRGDSIALLTQEGLIGDPIIDVIPGTMETKALKEGDEIPFHQTMGITDIAQDLRNRITPILDSTGRLLTSLSDKEGHFQQTLANADKLSRQLAGTTQKLDALLATSQNLMEKDVRSTVQQAGQNLQRLDAVSADLQQRIPPLLDQTQRSLAAAEHTMQAASDTVQDARKVIQNAAPKVPELLDRSNRLLRTGQESLDAARESWPLSWWLKSAPSKLPPPPQAEGDE